MGQLELISDIRSFILQANVTLFLSSPPTAGPRKSIMQQPVAFWMVQCELIARIFWSRKWAHMRIFRSGFQAAVGQFELISDICSFTPWANASMFPAAGPCESVIWQPVACWMGQFEAIARIL